MRAFRILGWVIFGLAAAAMLGLALGLPVMWLWNWLMPAIFGLGTITYWKAVGLLILCHMLFKGQAHGFGHRRRCGRGRHWDGFAERRPWTGFGGVVYKVGFAVGAKCRILRGGFGGAGRPVDYRLLTTL